MKIPPKELFYRLEQLRLMGFVEREPLNYDHANPRFGYRFIIEYARQLG